MWYFPLGLIILVGTLTSYTDLKYNKIKNRHLLLGLIPGILYYTTILCVYPERLGYGFLWHLLLLFSIGLIIYLSRAWPAGDVKLFLLLSFLVYTPNFLDLPSSVFLFLHIGVAGGLCILFLLIKRYIEQPIKFIKSIFSKKNRVFLAQMFIISFSFSWISTLLRAFLIPLGFSYLFIIPLYLIYGLSYFILEKTKHQWLVLLGIFIFSNSFHFMLQGMHIFEWSYILQTILYLIPYLIGYLLFTGTNEEFLTKQKEIENLRPNLKLAADVYTTDKQLVLKKDKTLSKEDIETLNSSYKEGRLKEDKLPVRETLSFAPIMFIGAILAYTEVLKYLIDKL